MGAQYRIADARAAGALFHGIAVPQGTRRRREGALLLHALVEYPAQLLAQCSEFLVLVFVRKSGTWMRSLAGLDASRRLQLCMTNDPTALEDLDLLK